MRKLLGLVLVTCGLALCAGAAHAQGATYARSKDLGALLATAALNGAAATRTFTILNSMDLPGSSDVQAVGGYAYATLEIVRTRTSGTDLSLTCVSTTRAATTPAAVRTTCIYDATGLCTSATATLKSTTSSTETLAWTVSVLGWRRTDCTFISTAAGAGDTIAVYGYLVAK